jgi:hypothetical protein
MKFSYLKTIIYSIIIFHINFCFPEGFTSGTLVKVPQGYVKIENLFIGDYISCYDSENNLTQGLITHILKKSANNYLRIEGDHEAIYIGCDQKLYDEISQSWIVANSFSQNDIINGKNFSINFIDEPIELYLLSIQEHHNFLVSKKDIRVHNFIPIIIGITVAFGAGSLEIAGISCGIAGLGTYLGYQWNKKNKQKHNFAMQFNNCGNGGMMPEDPEEEKKRKRDEARENFRPLTNKEAREQAEKLGYKETKSHPCKDTFDKPVFTNGRNYISPDRTGHKGGVWKLFNRRGDRVATVNIDLTKTIGT